MRGISLGVLQVSSLGDVTSCRGYCWGVLQSAVCRLGSYSQQFGEPTGPGCYIIGGGGGGGYCWGSYNHQFGRGGVALQEALLVSVLSSGGGGGGGGSFPKRSSFPPPPQTFQLPSPPPPPNVPASPQKMIFFLANSPNAPTPFL